MMSMQTIQGNSNSISVFLFRRQSLCIACKGKQKEDRSYKEQDAALRHLRDAQLKGFLSLFLNINKQANQKLLLLHTSCTVALVLLFPWTSLCSASLEAPLSGSVCVSRLPVIIHRAPGLSSVCLSVYICYFFSWGHFEARPTQCNPLHLDTMSRELPFLKLIHWSSSGTLKSTSKDLIFL